MGNDSSLVGILFGGILTFSLGVILGIYAAKPFVAKSHSPKEVVSARRDLNGDGIPDCIVIKNNKTEVKMFGVMRGPNIIWVPEKEYKKYGSITPRDYDEARGE